MTENEHDDLPPELASAYRAERERPPMDEEHARRLQLAVAAKLGPPPTPDGGSNPPEGGRGGAPPTAPTGGGATSLLSASHLAMLATGLATGVVVGALGQAALVTPPAPRLVTVQSASAASDREPVITIVDAAPATPAPATDDEPARPPIADEEPSRAATSLVPATEDRVATSLAAERRLVDSARAALAQGRHEPALSALATHRRRFPDGALAEERDALEVEALVAAGRRDEAAAAATGFEHRYPASLYRGRIRAIVTE